MPWIDALYKKYSAMGFHSHQKTSPIATFTLARAKERMTTATTALADDKGLASERYNSRDFISRFLAIRSKDPSIPEGYVTAWALSNIQAGSDTTAIMLRAVLYFLIKHPASLDKLLSELARARKASRLSEVVTWEEARALPYLDACIRGWAWRWRGWCRRAGSSSAGSGSRRARPWG